MPDPKRKSLYLSEDAWGIIDAIAKEKDMSRSEVVWHLVIYAGMCGGDFPLTRRVAKLPDEDRDRVVSEVRQRLESDDPPKPWSFREWVKEASGREDSKALDKAARMMVDDLLGKQ